MNRRAFLSRALALAAAASLPVGAAFAHRKPSGRWDTGVPIADGRHWLKLELKDREPTPFEQSLLEHLADLVEREIYRGRARPVFYVTRERKAQLVESGEWGRFVKESRPVTIDMSSGIPIAR